jgi:hypothetical protein
MIQAEVEQIMSNSCSDSSSSSGLFAREENGLTAYAAHAWNVSCKIFKLPDLTALFTSCFRLASKIDANQSASAPDAPDTSDSFAICLFASNIQLKDQMQQ